MKKRFCSLFFLTILCSITNAQNYLGISSSNYGGIHSVLMNPANIAESKHKFSVNVMAVGAEVQNNYLNWNAPYSIAALATNTIPKRYISSSGRPEWQSDYYFFQEKVVKAKLFMNAEFRGPALQFNSKNKGFGVAVGQRYRFMSSLVNTTPTLFQIIGTGTKNINLQNITFQDHTGLMNIGGYNEFYLSIGKVIREERESKYKVGITGRYILSNLNLGLNAENLKYTIYPTDFSNTQQNIIDATAIGSFFSAAPDGQDINLPWIFNQMTSLSAIGKGLGVDLGFTYEVTPSKTKMSSEFANNEFKLGVSLTDIGFVSYQSPSEVRAGAVNSVGVNIYPSTFSKLGSTDEFVDVIENQFFVDQTQYLRAFRVLMPAKIQVQADYRLKDKFYISAHWRQAVLSRKRLGPAAFSGISIIPRFEKEKLSFALPISLDQDYSNLNIGATMRAGPFFFGADNLGGWLNIHRPKGLSIHTGLLFGFGQNQKKNSMLDCFFDPNYKNSKGFLSRLFHKK